MITADELTINLALIEDHAVDAREAMESGDDDIIEASLAGIQEVVQELRGCLPQRQNDDLGPDDEDMASLATKVEEL